MKTKKTGKPSAASKATIEFAILILTAAILFSIAISLGLSDKFYEFPGSQHYTFDVILTGAGFFAAAIAIFAFRRWFELRRTYKKLAQSEEQLRFQAMLLDEIGDGVIATDFKGTITYVNQAQCNRIKISKDKLIGQSVEIYGQDPSLGATQKEIIQTTIEKGRWSGEICNTVSDGSKIIVECHTWLMKDKDGNPTGLCGVSRDITERKERERELLKHKRYLEALDTASGILLHSIEEIKYDEFLAVLGPASDADRVHIFLKVADENLRIPLRRKTQWCRNEKIPPVPTELTENRFFGKIFPQWQKTLATGRHICLSTENFPPQQLDFWESLRIKALLIVPVLIDNQLNGFMSFDNCTETRQWTESEIEFLRTAAVDLAFAIKRLEIKKELKKQRDFAQKLIETAQTIVLVLDKDANIVTFNPYFEKLSGRRLEEVKGKNWIDTFLPEEDRQKIRKLFATAITDISTKGNINPIIMKNSQFRYIEWFDKMLQDEKGNVTGLLSTGQDITERLKAEEQLKKVHLELEQRVIQRTAALQQINTQLVKTIEERDRIQKILQETEKLAGAGKLAAQIAHEINNPIAGIKNSFLLVKDAIDKNHPYFEYVGRIEKEIDRVSQIVRQMFDLYRPDTRSADKFKVREAIKDITELLKIASQEKQIHIEIDCPHNVTIVLSEALFRQVIYNIVQNAIQASPPQGIVKITALIDDSRLDIQVSDEGHGIDEKNRDKIFEPFFTTGSGGPGSGIGLGLSITKDIISAMDGTIDFTSKKDKGTVFNISIPIGNEPAK
ncbi:MAG: PAS domain S-box protein [Sedimentisphaerales bacterium]